ncbi:zinc finger protein 32 [Anabrus simplex]|uniref:zinc finger protein 32 n=1 Tax=Anabrus simplex TaxID=316456 RepID=UPI0035A2AA27
MEEPSDIKCESELPADQEEATNFVPNPLLPPADDMLVEIKVEPCNVFADENFDQADVSTVKEEYEIQENFELISDIKPVKEETKSELTEPGPRQENAFELYADIKEEISIEEDTVDELVPCVTKGNNCGNDAVAVHTGEEVLASNLRHRSFHNHLFIEQHSASSPRRPYQCKECGSSFMQKGSLGRHKVIHSGTRSFECQECHSSFNTKSDLSIHKEIHFGPRPYHCTTCNSSFGAESELRRHEIIHSGQRPYFCEICDCSFAWKSSRNRHMAVHSLVKPFQCQDCNSSFASKCNLRTHMVVHSGVRAFHCKQCKISFTQKGSLRRHRAIHTK